MTREGEEAAGISHHPDEAAQKSEVGEGVQLCLHPFLLVKEPPSAPHLDLARHTSILKVSDHGAEDVIIGRVQVVENGARQFADPVQRTEKASQRLGMRVVADGVASGIGPEQVHEPGIGVAESSDVELHGPAARGVPPGDLMHDPGGVGSLLRDGT